MKRLFYSISFVLIISCTFCTSCEKNESCIENLDNVTNNDTISNDSINNDYHIYEYDVETVSDTIIVDAFAWKYKKSYFDNRGIMITSATGDFGNNDTIMLHSDLYKSRALLYTNENNDVYRVFDGKYLLDIDYQDNGDYTINCFKEDCDSILFSIDFEDDEVPNITTTRGVKGKRVYETLDKFAKKYDRLCKSDKFEKDHPFYSYLIDKAKLEIPIEGAKFLANTLAEIESNPELHNQKILLNSLEFVGDVVGVFGTAFGGTLTGGALWTALGIEIASLVDDYNSLVNEIFLSDGLYDKYKEYYKEKYSINIHTNDATNTTSTNATLNGTFYCVKNIGRIYFRYWELWDDTNTINEIDANINGNNLSASICSLSPNTEYIYDIVYECIIDGIEFRYNSDFKTFKTDSYSAEAMIVDVKMDSLEIILGTIRCHATTDIKITIKDYPQELLQYLYFTLSCKYGSTDNSYIRCNSSDTIFTIKKKCTFWLMEDIDEIDYNNFVAIAKRQLDIVSVFEDTGQRVCSSFNFEFRYDDPPKLVLETPLFIESLTEKTGNDERNYYTYNYYISNIQCNGIFWFQSAPFIYECNINHEGERSTPEPYRNISNQDYLNYKTYFHSSTEGLFCGYCDFPATKTYNNYKEYWIEGELKNGNIIKSNILKLKNEDLIYYCPHIY